MHTYNDTRTRDNTLRLYTGHSRQHLVRVTLIAYAVALVLSLGAWLTVVRLALHIASVPFMVSTSAIIILGLGVAALAYYWSFDE